ncbi:MAG: TonB family protein [Bryobacterales bacterium]
MNFNIGDTMGGYEIVGVLGSGGMGEVYRVRNVISDRVDAMKVLLANLQREQDFGTRFLREIKVQARLVHPNIAQLYTAFEHDGNLIMIMELIDGLSLLELLQRGRIPLSEAIDYTRQALAALGYAHEQGVIHRDIKPGNIMVTRSGTVKLMDFGIAKAATDHSLTVTGNLIGSLYYMSPEQVKAISIDSRSDLYSVGIVLYQMATGKKPFDGDSEYRIMRAQVEDPPTPPTAIEPSVPDELSNVILRALAKDPAERFQTGEEFREALGRVTVLLKEDAAGATRMLGRDASPFRPREAPTAPLSAPVPLEPPSRQPAPSGESVRHYEPPAASTREKPVLPPPASRPGRPHVANAAPETDEMAEQRPARSRTPLWIAAGIAAAVLTVAATQMFDWMATGTSDQAASGKNAPVETPPLAQIPADRSQPPAADNDSPSTAPTSSATPPVIPAAQEVPRQTPPERQTPSERQTSAPARPNREAAAKAAANPPAEPQAAPKAPAGRTTPPGVELAPYTNNPPAARTSATATAPAAQSSPPPPLTASSGTAAGAAPVSQTPSRDGVPGAVQKAATPPPTTPAGSSQPQTGSTPESGLTTGASAAPASPEAPADRVYLPSEVDSLPDVLDRIQPRYSGAAAQARAEGVVRLEAEIWPDGRAHGIRVVQSAGHPDLDRNAVAALARWTFIPGRKNRLPVKVRARIDFPFSLQSTTQRPALSKDK